MAIQTPTETQNETTSDRVVAFLNLNEPLPQHVIESVAQRQREEHQEFEGDLHEEAAFFISDCLSDCSTTQAYIERARVFMVDSPENGHKFLEEFAKEAGDFLHPGGSLVFRTESGGVRREVSTSTGEFGREWSYTLSSGNQRESVVLTEDGQGMYFAYGPQGRVKDREYLTEEEASRTAWDVAKLVQQHGLDELEENNAKRLKLVEDLIDSGKLTEIESEAVKLADIEEPVEEMLGRVVLTQLNSSSRFVEQGNNIDTFEQLSLTSMGTEFSPTWLTQHTLPTHVAALKKKQQYTVLT